VNNTTYVHERNISRLAAAAAAAARGGGASGLLDRPAGARRPGGSLQFSAHTWPRRVRRYSCVQMEGMVRCGVVYYGGYGGVG
jgi:hypothetical protein